MYFLNGDFRKGMPRVYKSSQNITWKYTDIICVCSTKVHHITDTPSICVLSCTSNFLLRSLFFTVLSKKMKNSICSSVYAKTTNYARLCDHLLADTSSCTILTDGDILPYPNSVGGLLQTIMYIEMGKIWVRSAWPRLRRMTTPGTFRGLYMEKAAVEQVGNR